MEKRPNLPPHTPEGIRADVFALRQETENLLGEIISEKS